MNRIAVTMERESENKTAKVLTIEARLATKAIAQVLGRHLLTLIQNEKGKSGRSHKRSITNVRRKIIY